MSSHDRRVFELLCHAAAGFMYFAVPDGCNDRPEDMNRPEKTEKTRTMLLHEPWPMHHAHLDEPEANALRALPASFPPGFTAPAGGFCGSC